MGRPKEPNCPKCGNLKDGKHSYCKKCAAEYYRNHRSEFCGKCGGPRTGKHKSYCIECAREYNRTYFVDKPGKKAEYKRKSTYGLTQDVFEAMMEEQSGLCLICNVELQEGRGRGCLAVDHDHETGEVRSLLCQRCNMVIGQADDNPDLLVAAAAYLVRWQLRNSDKKDN